MRNGVAGAVGVGAVGGGEQPDPEFVRRGIRFLRGTYSHPVAATHLDAAGEMRPRVPLYAFHIRRKRALMSIGSLGGICSFAGTAAIGHAHP